MGSLSLILGGAGKGILAELTFINGLKENKSTALIFFRKADCFKNKSKNEAIALMEIKEMKIGGTFRSIVLVGMRFLKKWSVFKDG